MFLKLRSGLLAPNHPLVQASTPGCDTSVNYLRAGPPSNMLDIIAGDTAWTDTTFEGDSAIYWEGYDDGTVDSQNLIDGLKT